MYQVQDKHLDSTCIQTYTYMHIRTDIHIQKYKLKSKNMLTRLRTCLMEAI